MATMKTPEAAKYAKMSQPLLLRYARAGEIGVKKGRDWRFVDWQIDLWLAGMNAPKEVEKCQSTNVKIRLVGGVDSPSTVISYKKALELPTR